MRKHSIVIDPNPYHILNKAFHLKLAVLSYPECVHLLKVSLITSFPLLFPLLFKLKVKYGLTHSTEDSRFDKIIVAQLVNKFTIVCGSHVFIIFFTTACQ
jgi:hypothetical protein